jgi:hypothetical protein
MDPHLDVESELFSINRKASVFIPAAIVFAERIRKELKKHDFSLQTWKWQGGLKVGIESELENAALRGAVLTVAAEEVRPPLRLREAKVDGHTYYRCT